jgi:hypothetical protein
MKFVAYQNTLNPKAFSNNGKFQIMQNFISGVLKCGDETILHSARNILDHDVGMMVGWVHEKSNNSNHLTFRKQIIDWSMQRKKRVLIADSNLFLYANLKNYPKYYLRYSFDGIFPNSGDYCDKIINSDRWKIISRDHNISLKDYRQSGDHILLCLQRNGGWSMGNYDVIDWTVSTINTIRQHSDRPIVIRAHPGDKGSKDYLSANNIVKKIGHMKNITLSPAGTTLIDDLKNCWAVVNYNSSPTVGAAIEGYPIFVTDPSRSQCAEIANLNLLDIENPKLFDRQKWIERISMFHWNFNETKNGECWNHMRKYV